MIGTAKTKAIHSIVFYQLSGPRGVKNALSTQQLLVLFIYNRKISKIEDTVRFTGFYDHEPRAGYLGEGGGVFTLGGAPIATGAWYTQQHTLSGDRTQRHTISYRNQ